MPSPGLGLSGGGSLQPASDERARGSGGCFILCNKLLKFTRSQDVEGVPASPGSGPERQAGRQIEALVKEPVMMPGKSWFCTLVTGIHTAFSMGVTSSFNDTKDSLLF